MSVVIHPKLAPNILHSWITVFIHNRSIFTEQTVNAIKDVIIYIVHKRSSTVTLLYPLTEKIEQNRELEFNSNDGVMIKVRFIDLFDLNKSLEKQGGVVMGYTHQQIIDKCFVALKDAKTFYKQSFINYVGKTSDTDEYYTEVIAEFLCKNLSSFINGIPEITRRETEQSRRN